MQKREFDEKAALIRPDARVVVRRGIDSKTLAVTDVWFDGQDMVVTAEE
jgi:hypothetical protein